eukprot:gene35704-46318_t
MYIPECYPFRPVDVRAEHPIWHPNIDLQSGRVILPLDWSPTLTLNSVALAVQMIMLEPSAENPTNLDAYHYYDGLGVTISGGTFISVLPEPVTNQEDRLMDDGGLDVGGMSEEVRGDGDREELRGSISPQGIRRVDGGSVDGRARKRPSSLSSSAASESDKRQRVSLITS